MRLIVDGRINADTCERHPIYVCLESDYEKVKHLDD